jgi:LysM repeat protein
VTRRSPARLLAPAALVAAAVALFAVFASSGGDNASSPTAAPTPVATATATAEGGKKQDRKKADTYTVEPGDTPSGIAETTGVDLDALLAANPDIDASALTVGQELELP